MQIIQFYQLALVTAASVSISAVPVLHLAGPYVQGNVATAATTKIPHLTNDGGITIPSVSIQPLFFGNVVYATELEGFYIHVTNTKWWDILSQYGIKRGSSIQGKHIRADPQNLHVKDLKTLLFNMVKTGYLKPEDCTYFPIHFSPDIVVTSESGQVSCKDWCGTHGAVDLRGSGSRTPYLFYGIIPDFSAASSGCYKGCGSGNTLENIMKTSAHELAEAVTNPAGNIQGKGAWYDGTDVLQQGHDDGEIADICPGQLAKTIGDDGKEYAIQRIWSNAHGACVASVDDPKK
ncbi:UNVERIFIED_CONTAM: hypothetical protein HDU68_010389 [Siphonaria sp. JEL0065]|nr:hypothetical protein HDU68_010389 [Siphonaria sp. JEL0065]